MPRAGPSSQWTFGSKSNFGRSPTVLNTTFSFSSLPYGVRGSARFGIVAATDLSSSSISVMSLSRAAILSPTVRIASILACRSAAAFIWLISFETALRSALSISASERTDRLRSSSFRIASTGELSICRSASDLRTRSGFSRIRLISSIKHLHDKKNTPPSNCRTKGRLVVPPALLLCAR